MSSLSQVGRLTATNKTDRVSLCTFTFSDGRRCRTPRVRNNAHFCFYHAQKEARARTAQKLGKDLSYFFSGDYLSACDLSTALARLIPSVVRGDVKPRAARTVAYLAQTLIQSIHISEQEYINAFGSDGWRKSIRNSVKGNYDYRFPPAPESEPSAPSALPTSLPSASLPPHPQPAAVAQAGIHPDRVGRPEEPASSSNSPLTTHHSPLPAPSPSPHTPLPPTSAEFVQHVVAGLAPSVCPDSTGDTGESQAPQPPAAQPSSVHPPSPIPTQTTPPPTPAPAPSPASSQESSLSSNPSLATHHSPLAQTPAPNRNADALHFDHNCRLLIDGKPV